ncbi:MAG: GNAT family N-acetyltransferase [Gammaproteobacteria bacterium]|nr:GNAT family N-acetyltransferase [Gammaproteobacteria bacterium]
MTLEILPYDPGYAEAWDALCAGAMNATFLHTRRFIGYHEDRFRDRSLLVFASGRLEGVFPAAEAPADRSVVISHPGITYGGLVHRGRLRGLRMVKALEAIARYYGGLGYARLHYKAVPFIYMRLPAQDDLYALMRLGARRVRCDLSSAIDLVERMPVSERRRRGLGKAKKSVRVSDDPALLEELWGVIAENLARRHKAVPVHTLRELALLRDRFPRDIVIRCAVMDGKVEAGIVLFNSRWVWHAQYIAASEAGYAVSALDAVFDATIDEARSAGARFFDFGTCNDRAGVELNEDLYRYKSEFGGGGVVHEYYEVGL